MQYQSSLGQEALVVGASSVPFFLAADLLVDQMNLRLSPRTKTIASSFLAGVLFHISAEYAGLNEWYAKHGAHRLKSFLREEKRKNVARSRRGRHCGRRGFSRMAEELAEGL